MGIVAETCDALEAHSRGFPHLPSRFWIADSPIYLDGSCLEGTHPELAAGGAAALQLDGQGFVTRSVWAQLPSWVGTPSAVAAEHYAVAMVSCVEAGPWHHITDCQSVIQAAATRSTKDWHKTMFAGFWQAVDVDASFSKVKAHQSKEAAKAKWQDQWWKGTWQWT